MELLTFYWSPEVRKRLGLDEPGIHVIPTNEPYDRAKILGVDMSVDELRALLQRFVDEERKTQPAAALRSIAKRLHEKAESVWVDHATRAALHQVAIALEDEVAELGR